jgi:L-seryl-tRNA(Ser) seleniumtransferase
VDKLTLAALEATLRGAGIPTVQALEADRATLVGRAAAIAETLRVAGIAADLAETDAEVGGGGAPGVLLPSAAVSLPAPYAELLRHGEPAVLGRVENGRCLLDLRAVPAAMDDRLRAAVVAATPTDPPHSA